MDLYEGRRRPRPKVLSVAEGTAWDSRGPGPRGLPACFAPLDRLTRRAPHLKGGLGRRRGVDATEVGAEVPSPPDPVFTFYTLSLPYRTVRVLPRTPAQT